MIERRIPIKNHWLDAAKKKQLFKEIDELAMDIWAVDGTFGDLIAQLTDEQTDFLMDMRWKDVAADHDDLTFGLELIVG